MEKPPVNPVNKVELPKTEQTLEHFSLSEQEKNIQEVFKLSPELESIALEATKSGETISLYRIENKNIEKEPDGITSHKDLKGQWFSPDLETALVYLRKSQQTFGTEAKRVEGANLVVVKIPKEEFENLHVSKHPIASQMDVENDNYIIPENIERNYISIDDVQDKVGNFENLQKAKEQIKEKVKQFETKEAVELYREYLKTIFPESKVQEIVWHGNREDFKDSGFDKNKGRDNKFSDDGQFYGFYFGDFYSHYGRPGNISYPSLVDIKKLKIVDLEFDPILSGIDVTKNIRGQYKLTDEDGILQIGTDHFNDNVPKEDYEKHDSEMQKKFLDYLHSKGKNFEEIEKGTQEITKQDVNEYLEKNGITALGIAELVVFEQEQIHILGSKSDIKKFKEFVLKNENVETKKLLPNKFEKDIQSNKQKFLNELSSAKIGNVEVNIELDYIMREFEKVKEIPQVIENAIKIQGLNYDLAIRKEYEDIKLYILGKDGQTFNAFRSNNEKVAGWIAQGDYSLGNEEKMYNSKDHWGVSVTPELKGSGLADFLYDLKSLVNNQLEYEHVTETNYGFLTFYIKKGYIPYSLIKLPNLNEEILDENQIKNIVNDVIDKRKTKDVILEKDMEHAIKLKFDPAEASKLYGQITNLNSNF